MIALDHWFVPPVAALVLSLFALAPLGAQVLRRGVVFIDLALAQSAAAAALWTGSVVDHPSVWTTQAAATLGAMACVAAVATVSRRRPQDREALIGLLYALTAGAALLGATRDPHGNERLTQLLAADVLWAGWTQVAVMAGCAVWVAAIARQLSRDAWFYPTFAVVASLAVPRLGLFVVFSLLIAPGLWQRARGGWRTALTGSAIAVAIGLLASWMLDQSSGACVAVALSVFGLSSCWSTGTPNGDARKDVPPALQHTP